MLHEPLNCWNEKVVTPSETTVSPVTLSVLATVTIRQIRSTSSEATVALSATTSWSARPVATLVPLQLERSTTIPWDGKYASSEAEVVVT